MRVTFKNHRIIAFILNLLIVILIFLEIKIIDDDKAIVFFIGYYPVLIILNFLIWLPLKLLKKEQYKIYSQTTIALLALLIPFFIIATML
jgi:hypothetical protein